MPAVLAVTALGDDVAELGQSVARAGLNLGAKHGLLGLELQSKYIELEADTILRDVLSYNLALPLLNNNKTILVLSRLNTNHILVDEGVVLVAMPVGQVERFLQRQLKISKPFSGPSAFKKCCKLSGSS